MKKVRDDDKGEDPSDSSDGEESGSSESESDPPGDEGSVDWGGEASLGEDDGKKKGKKKKKKGKDEKGSRSSEDEKKKDRKADKEKRKPSKDEKKKKKRPKKKKKKRRGSDKSGKRGKEKTEKDKGPFGMGETRRMVKDVDEEETESGSDTSGSSQSFRKAPSGLTLHLRLQRYAMKHPGRLATRLLQRMEKVCRLGGASVKTGLKPNHVQPCALAYYLTILTPSLKDRWSPRTQRELRVLVEVLDHLADRTS